MHKFVLSIFLTLLITHQAGADEFNTYRWNRKNQLNGNGKIDKRPWFEWWYYKIVLPESNESFYFVYGVVNPWDKEQKKKGSRSYVGMGDFKQKFNSESIFTIDDFSASYTETSVQIKGNSATNKNFQGNIKDEMGMDIIWDVDITRNNFVFNSIGWAQGTMITNIEWYVAQGNALCSGKILSQGKLHEFTDAPCYQDRNWGFSFPEWWTWIVSNQFDNFPETALAVGGGKPKYFDINIPYAGVAIGLKHKGETYEFRPNNLDLVKININFGTWEAEAINSTHKVQVVATAPKDQFMDLQFMTPEGSIFHDYETLTGEVTVKLYEDTGFIFRNWKLIDTIYSPFAGIEYGSTNVHEAADIFNSFIRLF